MSAATAAAAQLAFIGWAEELSARALAAFESSAKQRRSLLADAPGDVLLREGLAVLHQRLGQLQQFVMRDAFAAQGHYEKYLELASGLASERPDDQRAQLMRLAALDKVAKCHVALQNYEAATPLFVEILELRTRHQSENPGARNAQALATTHVGAAGLHRAIGFDEQRPVAARRAALAKALVHYRVALPIFVELQEAGGGGRTLDNATRVREWIAACEKLLGGLASTETPSD